MRLVVRLRRHLNRRRRRRLGPCPWLLLLQQLLALQRRSRTVCRVLRDGLAPARVADRAGILVDDDRAARREPLAGRQLLGWRLFFYKRDVLLVVLLAARAAHVRVDAAAHAESGARRSRALLSPPPRPAALPLTWFSTLLCLPPWLDVQRGGQLREEQPHAAEHVAVAGVDQHRARERRQSTGVGHGGSLPRDGSGRHAAGKLATWVHVLPADVRCLA